MNKRYWVSLAVPAIAALPFVGGCGGGLTSTVKVGSLKSSTRRSAPSFRAFPDDAPQSNTAYSFAKVDGVKLNLTRLQVVTGTSEQDIVTWSPSKEVVVAPGGSNTIDITETASITAGSYTGLKLRYENSYKVKAYCRTANSLVYTSATGIKTAALSTSTIPADYDYYAYPFAAVTVATSATGGNPETMEETDSPFTIAEGSTPQLSVLIDPSYLVTCFDGSTTNASNPDALSPFMWGNNNGLTTADFFPDNVANFGIGYLPVFIWISTDSTEAPPTAEVYVSSTDNTKVADPIDFLNTNITSFAFKADGTMLDARTRIGAGGSSGTLYQMTSGFTFSDPNYTFYDGEWQCDAGYTNCGPIQDRQVVNFARTADMTSVVTATNQDGPDCGKTGTFPGHPEWGNRYRACLGTGVTENLYFRQVPR